MGKLGMGSYRGGGDVTQAHLKAGADCALLAFTGMGEAILLKTAKPNMVIVGRPLWLDPEQNDLVLVGDPYLKGQALADRILNQFGHLPVEYWQGLCEGPINAQRTALFELGFTRRMHAAGKKVCVFNWPVGNGLTPNMGIPMVPDHDLTLPEVRELFAEADCLGVHAYGSDNRQGGTGLMQDEPIWNALRFLRWRAYYQSQGWPFPKVFLTEFSTHYSWRSGGDPPPVFAKSAQEIIQDFSWLGAIIEQDPDCLGAAAFCYGAEAGAWTGFNLEFEPLVRAAMAEWNQNHPGGVVMPQPLTPEQIHTMRDNLWKDAGAGGFNPNTALSRYAASKGYVPYGPEHYDLVQSVGIVYQGFYGAKDGLLVAWADVGWALTEGLPLPPV